MSTKTKRRNQHAQNEPIPGDVVVMKAEGNPLLKRPGDYQSRVCWVRQRERAVVLGVSSNWDGWYDWLCLMTLDCTKVGWLKVSQVEKEDGWRPSTSGRSETCAHAPTAAPATASSTG